mmetsp:Transcript_66/g.343  ORF Transcript_66/g.343 Transcript_66/m.343 type:complete len:218 (-) Transcript_66:29-682(-)
MDRPYDSPSVDLPSILTNQVATRSPSPVCTNPLAKKKANTMSQMTSLVIAENACWKVRVLVTTHMERPQKAHAPTGRGVSTSPAMVERKMARSVHAWGRTPAGQGMTNFTTNPTATERSAGTIFAPFHTNPGDVAASDDAAATSPAKTTGAGAEDARTRRASAGRCARRADALRPNVEANDAREDVAALLDGEVARGGAALEARAAGARPPRATTVA